MFTGLVEEVGIVQRLEHGADGGRLTVSAQRVLEGTALGDSISVSGACLTVVLVGRREFSVECMPETLSRTTIGSMRRGDEVNLERSLTWGGRVGGHLVTGHVDTVATVVAVERKGISLEVKVMLPDEILSYVTAKGSIAVDGVSLTVIQTDSRDFVVGLIPHTVENTTLRHLRTGTKVNLEADLIARYVHRSVIGLGPSALGSGSQAGGVTEELLRDKGFI
jgi:riboflavin synthase